MTRRKKDLISNELKLSPLEWSKKYKARIRAVERFGIKEHLTSNLTEIIEKELERAKKIKRKVYRGNKTDSVIAEYKNAKNLLAANQRIKNRTNSLKTPRTTSALTANIILPFVEWCASKDLEPSAKIFESKFNEWTEDCNIADVKLNLRKHEVKVKNPSLEWENTTYCWRKILDEIKYLKTKYENGQIARPR